MRFVVIFTLFHFVLANQDQEAIIIDLWSDVMTSAGYDEFCDNVDFICNSTIGLVCSNDICKCLNSSTMIFDNELLKCVSLVGGECQIEPPADEDEFHRACAGNMECRSNGICGCAYSYVAYEDKLCREPVLNLEFGQHCNTSHFCNYASILLCNHETSSCDCTYQDTMVYDSNIKKCRSLADRDSNCHFAPIGGIFMDCIDNALCYEDDEDPFGPGYCRCSSGFTVYEDRFCRRPTIQHYGMSCNSSHICEQTEILHCNNADNTCGCIPFSGMFYEEESSACVSGVGAGSTCFMKPLGGMQRMCTKHSGCVPRPGVNTDLGICSCTDTYVPYEDNTCGLPTFEQSYRERCNSSMQCKADGLLTCDSTSELCQCKYEGDIFQIGLNQCFSPANGLCFTEMINDEIRNCVRNSHCETFSESNGKFGYCKCDYGYGVELISGKCIKGLEATTIAPPEIFLGDICTSESPELPCTISNASCVEVSSAYGLCNCNDGFEASEDKRVCRPFETPRVKIGEACHEGLLCDIENGNCTKISHGIGICECNDQYIPASNKESCLLEEASLIGDSCSNIEPIVTCKVENSDCSDTANVCECLQGYTPSEEKDSCVENNGASISKTAALAMLSLNLILLLIIY